MKIISSESQSDENYKIEFINSKLFFNQSIKISFNWKTISKSIAQLLKDDSLILMNQHARRLLGRRGQWKEISRVSWEWENSHWQKFNVLSL